MGLNFSIEYKQGKENVVADTLARQQPVGSLAAIFQVTSQLMMEAKDSWKRDYMLQKIVDKIRWCQQPYKQYTFDGQFMRRKGKVVVTPFTLTANEKRKKNDADFFLKQIDFRSVQKDKRFTST